MQYTRLDATAYERERNRVLATLENPFLADGQQLDVYGNIYDVLGNPTTGFGYDLTQHGVADIRKDLLGAWGLEPAASDAEISAKAPVLAEGLEKITAWKDGRMSAAALCAWRPASPLLDTARGETLLGEILQATYEPALDTAVSRHAPGVTVPPSRERIALCSLVFNGGPGMIGPGLGEALTTGDRAGAWYQIRWNSNGGNVAGIATRRAFEGTLFGLYDDPAAPTASETAAVKALETAHGTAMSAADHRFPDATRDANANYADLLALLPAGTVPTLAQALASTG